MRICLDIKTNYGPEQYAYQHRARQTWMEFRGSEADNFENEGQNDEEFQENHTNFKYRACVVGPEGATTELHKDLWYQCLKEPKSDTQGIELKMRLVSSLNSQTGGVLYAIKICSRFLDTS